jgi:serine/threonine protein kinase
MGPASSIANYGITPKLGEGGMSEVYRATDTKLNREVTIKVLPESFAQGLDRMVRFTRQAQLLASLNRPNIAAIHIPRVRVQFVDGRDSCRAIKVRRGCSQVGARLRIDTMPRMLRLTRLPAVAELV